MRSICRMRIEKESNYIGLYANGKTIRFQIEDEKPITDLIYPEFYDIKITSKCSGGCDFCYMNSTDKSSHVLDAVEKIESFFGPMTMNQRPFQIAIGGGEPTEHPYFVEILEKLDSLSITPNYTTNGTIICDHNENTDKIIEATQKYCGGVAVSCHPHLRDKWEIAINNLKDISGIKLSFHHIIYDIESVNRFVDIFENSSYDFVHYHVLLPQVAQGRAQSNCERNAVVYLFNYLESLPKHKRMKVAFGARFYLDLIDNQDKIPGVSLYEPEAFSKFLDLKDMQIYGSSFESMAVDQNLKIA